VSFSRSKFIFCADLESGVREQVQLFLDHPAFEGGTIRIMPDVHAGKGAVIGFTATLGEKVIPNVIGVDIGCGVAAWELSCASLDAAALDRFVRREIPAGFETRGSVAEDLKRDTLRERIEEVASRTGVDRERALRSVGTLGGGNHFIEVDRDDAGKLWLVIHSGSRNFGLHVATHHQEIALRRQGKMRGLEFLEGNDADAYIEDMRVAQEYARFNRQTMGRVLVEEFFQESLSSLRHVESVHNYIDFEDRVIRKGAIAARSGLPLIIPWNMRDGSVIGRGRGNADWNLSAPHGAGRQMSRREAKRQLSVKEFQSSMEGIWTSCVSKSTVDEAPMAYKDSATIRAWLEPTVTIEKTLRPVYNFKAAEA
jgi:RNA-splicing ligase RtcB